MLFNSAEFLFFFLPTTLVVFLLILKTKNSKFLVSWLVVASLFFYGWWNPTYLILIAFSMVFNFNLGKHIARKSNTKLFLVVGILVNLSFLAYFKYTNFIVEQINTISAVDITLKNIVLPLAISFFTFQQIAYLVDAKKQLTSEYSFLNYSLFVTFFPQLIAGPIVHHKAMLPQFDNLSKESFDYTNIAIGLSIFAIGLFKKTVLADSLAPYANIMFSKAETGATLTFFEAWGGALAYTFQLYFDFSGYSDMAIGIARMFGIILPLNFYSPYKATNISEFWRRWHITLSNFLRDYVYIPLGGNKHGSFNRYRNLLTTMLLGGIWHGAGWNFILWGLMHGMYLTAQQIWTSFIPSVSIVPKKAKIIAAWAATFTAVVFAWVLFRASSIDGAITMITGMLGFNGIAIPNSVYGRLEVLNPLFEALDIGSFLGGGTNFLFTWLWIGLSLAIVLTLPNLQDIFNTKKYSTSNYSYLSKDAIGTLVKIQWNKTILWAIASAIFFALGVLTLSQVSEFLYFQF